MKKSQAYVTRGAPAARALPEWEPPPPAPRVPHPSALDPADLPRDRGMAGPVGAYEVPPLSRAVDASLQALAERLRGAPLDDAEAALDALLPPAERHRVAVEALEGGRLVLAVRREDRFRYARLLAPRLRASLAPAHGPLDIRLIER